tara:strand:+ start:628 stop:1062 length:435 start_codon:yes stop_codon:yes gene_type:complete
MAFLDTTTWNKVPTNILSIEIEKIRNAIGGIVRATEQIKENKFGSDINSVLSPRANSNKVAEAVGALQYHADTLTASVEGGVRDSLRNLEQYGKEAYDEYVVPVEWFFEYIKENGWSADKEINFEKIREMYLEHLALTNINLPN